MAKINAMKNNRNRGSKYSEAEKRRFIEQFKRSGINRHRFSRKKGINYFTFLDWLKKEKSGQSKRAETGFREVKVITSQEIFAEVDLGNGKRIRFYQAPTTEYLKQIFSL